MPYHTTLTLLATPVPPRPRVCAFWERGHPACLWARRGGRGARAPGSAPTSSVTDPLVPLRTAWGVSGRGDAGCNAARESSRMAELDTPEGGGFSAQRLIKLLPG